ncbi:MAG: aldo/keto reductase [Lachnospirales bacterium]
MYIANNNRYNNMTYKRVGNSGLLLPIISLGLWHNFGDVDNMTNQKEILFSAFDSGITHFDLANNYGPPYGTAEKNFGIIFNKDLKPYRDEIIISTKAGYDMWEGPYGNFGSKKYLTASLDQSLKRLQVDYVDIFYHHRPDPNTPLLEIATTLDLFVKQGKALYIGVSNYTPEQTKEISKIFKELKTPFIIHQPKYNMFHRTCEDGLFETLKEEGLGSIVFSPLAQGLLTNRYINGIPADSRAGRESSRHLNDKNVNETIEKVKQLNVIAENRGQSLAQMALSWCLKDDNVTSVLIGASKVSQLQDNLKSKDNTTFSSDELQKINDILK